MRLLIADDNRRMRQFLFSLVQDLVSENWEAEDGIDAVEKYAQHRPDVVLMDVRMPFMDGLEAARKIRENDADAQVVIVTDFDNTDYRTLAKSIGVHRYLLKDDLFDLHGILENISHRQR